MATLALLLDSASSRSSCSLSSTSDGERSPSLCSEDSGFSQPSLTGLVFENQRRTSMLHARLSLRLDEMTNNNIQKTSELLTMRISKRQSSTASLLATSAASLVDLTSENELKIAELKHRMATRRLKTLAEIPL